MTRSALHDTFRIERHFDAAPPKVFAAFADPAAKARWFGGPAEITALGLDDVEVVGVPGDHTLAKSAAAAAAVGAALAQRLPQWAQE